MQAVSYLARLWRSLGRQFQPDAVGAQKDAPGRELRPGPARRAVVEHLDEVPGNEPPNGFFDRSEL